MFGLVVVDLFCFMGEKPRKSSEIRNIIWFFFPRFSQQPSRGLDESGLLVEFM